MEVCGVTVSTAFYIVSWFVANVSTILLNKYIFQILGFVYPTTLTLVHMITCTVGAAIVLKIVRPNLFVKVDWRDYIHGVLPIAVLFCFNIVLGNVSLRWVPASFMQTIKSSVPFFTVTIDRLVLQNPVADTRIYFSLIPIVGGVMLATWTEVNFELTGFLAAVLASIVTAAQANLSAKLMKSRMDSINLLYYMAPISAGILAPYAFVAEYDSIVTRWAEEFGPANMTIVLIISGLIAFTLNILTFLVINNTSALTYTVIGNVKVIFSIVFSVLLFKNEIGVLNGVGCAVTVFGAWWYSHIQYEVRTRKTTTIEPPNVQPEDKSTV